MAKYIRLSMILIASLTMSSVAMAGQKFVPPANVGDDEPVDLMQENPRRSSVVVETQTPNGFAEPTYNFEDPALYNQSTATVTTTTVEAQAPAVDVQVEQPQQEYAVGEAGDVLPNRPDSFFKPLLYVDIRDIANREYNKIELRGAATLLMRVMEAAPQRFVGPAYGLKINSNVSTHLRFIPEGARGPEGHEEEIVDGQGITRTVYKIDNTHEDTVKNTILGAEFEGIREVRREGGDVGAKIVDLNMIIFVRDDSASVTNADGSVTAKPNIYFRRISMRIDWTKPTDAEKVIVYGLIQPDIPLSDTAFEAYVGLLDRKIIMMDRKNLIYKVFPIGVGALDIRTDFGMDFARRGSRTQPAKKTVEVDTLTGEIPKAVLTKASVWRESQWGTNTRSRTWPAYYKGRPFIGIRDISNGDPVYTLVGMHYRITSPLARAFVSHGCIRTRDQDLYQEDAILNDGPLDQMPIKVVNTLDGFYDQFNPLMPQENSWYMAAAYSTLPTDNNISCQPIGLQQTFKVTSVGTCQTGLNKYGNCPGVPEDKAHLADTLSVVKHTFSDHECLPRTWPVTGDASGIVDYMRGKGGYRPNTLNLNWEHFTESAEDAAAQSPQAEFTNESGTKRREFNLGDIFTDIFGGGQREEQVIEEKPVVRVLSAKDRQAYTLRYNEFAACVNQNNQWRKANKCKQGKYSAIFLSEKEQNCNTARANEESCRSQAAQIGELLGINH